MSEAANREEATEKERTICKMSIELCLVNVLKGRLGYQLWKQHCCWSDWWDFGAVLVLNWIYRPKWHVLYLFNCWYSTKFHLRSTLFITYIFPLFRRQAGMIFVQASVKASSSYWWPPLWELLAGSKPIIWLNTISITKDDVLETSSYTMSSYVDRS